MTENRATLIQSFECLVAEKVVDFELLAVLQAAQSLPLRIVGLRVDVFAVVGPKGLVCRGLDARTSMVFGSGCPVVLASLRLAYLEQGVGGLLLCAQRLHWGCLILKVIPALI